MVLGCLTRIELARSKEHQGHNLTRLTSIRLRHSASGGYRTHFPRIGTGFTDRLPDLRRTDIVVYSVIALLYQTLFLQLSELARAQQDSNLHVSVNLSTGS